MGKTAFRGPVYGAKGNLFSFSFAAGASTSNASTALLLATSFQIPSFEAVCLTGFYANVSTCSSNNAQFKVKIEAPAFEGNSSFSTTIFTLGSGTSTSISSRVEPTAPTPSEYEGFLCPPNSTIRIVSSANSAMGVTNLNVHGFPRFVDSTRAS